MFKALEQFVKQLRKPPIKWHCVTQGRDVAESVGSFSRMGRSRYESGPRNRFDYVSKSSLHTGAAKRWRFLDLTGYTLVRGKESARADRARGDMQICSRADGVVCEYPSSLSVALWKVSSNRRPKGSGCKFEQQVDYILCGRNPRALRTVDRCTCPGYIKGDSELCTTEGCKDVSIGSCF